MEKKQLLLISKNEDLIAGINTRAGFSFEVTSVKSVHAGYTLALSYLPDAILIDYTAMESQGFQNLENFRSTHFLNRSYLFLYGEEARKSEVEKVFGTKVDQVLLNSSSYEETWEQIEDATASKRCLTNYWKDSFMGLFNLLAQPVILLQNETIIAMNDAFKKYFFVSNPVEIKITDFIDCENKYKVLETMKKFVRGKHMKASTTTSLMVMNNKLREAKITFSKLDKALSGQMVMMIDFTGKENPITNGIGTASTETEQYFERNNSIEAFKFTKREKEIIELLCKGYKTKEISEALCISSKTIEKHRANIIKRTNSDTILESVVYAVNHKLVDI